MYSRIYNIILTGKMSQFLSNQ